MEHTYENQHQESVFTGGVFGMLGLNLATAFVTGISFGLAFPWILCWRETWFKKHTYINGRQLYFTGTGMQLIGNWLKWLLLTVVTVGIYSLWLPVKIEQWTVKHTCFSDQALFDPPAESEFHLTVWVKDVANTIKVYALQIRERLCIWIQGISGSWTCTCGHRNSAGSHFCSACGKKQETAAYCTNCGAPLEPNAKFCGNCAHPVR